MPKRVSKATTLLNRIVDFYLNSHDFNGIRANVVLGDSPDAPETLKKLVARGLVEVYSSVYDNPYKTTSGSINFPTAWIPRIGKQRSARLPVSVR